MPTICAFAVAVGRGALRAHAAMRCLQLAAGEASQDAALVLDRLELVPGRLAQRVGQRLDRAGAGMRDRRRNRHGFRRPGRAACCARCGGRRRRAGRARWCGAGRRSNPRRRRRPRSRRSWCAGCWSRDPRAVIIRQEVSAWMRSRRRRDRADLRARAPRACAAPAAWPSTGTGPGRR